VQLFAPNLPSPNTKHQPCRHLLYAYARQTIHQKTATSDAAVNYHDWLCIGNNFYGIVELLLLNIHAEADCPDLPTHQHIIGSSSLRHSTATKTEEKNNNDDLI